MMTRVLVASLAGAVVMFGLGFLIYGLLLMEFMKANMVPEAAKLMKDSPNLVLLFVSNFAFAWLYAFIFERWASIKTFASGLMAGALIALPIAIGIDLNLFSTINIMQSVKPLIVDILAVTVMSAIVGGVIGQVLGMLNKNQASD